MFQSSTVGTVVLLAWIPFSVIVFASMRPTFRAAVFLTFFGWLFLPNTNAMIPGFPDFGKYSAGSLGLLIGILMVDSQRLLAFRPRWIDLPMVVWCLGNIPTSLLNPPLTLYDGLSFSLGYLWQFGIPYLVGRLYFRDRESLLELARGVMVAGLAYAPLCVWEIRMSPQLHQTLYGISRWAVEPPRYGLGYRPLVFLLHGLETGMWMSMAALTAVWLSWNGEVKRVWGLPAKPLAAGLLVVAVLCRAAGAVGLMVFGLAVLFLSRRLGRRTFLVVLLLLPPTYIAVRTSRIWSGRELVDLSRILAGDERARSLQFRLDYEQFLLGHALDRPVWGWGGHGRHRVGDETGRDVSITDGFWLIVLGVHGFVGLIALVCCYELPVLRLVRRMPARALFRPENAPCTALMVVVPLQLIDSLFNAFPTSLYFTMMGALASYNPARGGQIGQTIGAELAEADALASAGALEEAEAVCRRILDTISAAGPTSPDRRLAAASALQTLGPILNASGRSEEACETLSTAAQLWQMHADAYPDEPAACESLALTLEELARILRDRGQAADAVGVWRSALAARARIAETAQDAHAYAESLGDLAWFLTLGAPTGQRDPITAAPLAEKAAELAPDQACHWCTLGAAQLHAGDPLAAVASLGRSVDLSHGGSMLDYYLLALSHARLGHLAEAEHWFALAEAVPPVHPEPPALAEVRIAAALATSQPPRVADITSP